MKNLWFAVVTVFGAAACTSAQASKLDANDDLHCSVATFYISRSDKAMTEAAARTLFISSAWYNKQLGNKVDLSKATPILEKVKSDPVAARTIAVGCIQRALQNSAFERFGIDATDAWNRARGAAATSNR